jgi:hypothetical protein
MMQVDRGTWFLDAPEGLDQTPRAPFHEMRVYQMNQAYERLLDYKPQLRKFSWGQLLTGHLEYGMADNLHPNNFGAILWSDMVFYYLSTL